MICKYFLPFCRLSFPFVDGFLCCAEAFSLMQSHLFIFAFVAFTFGVRSKKSLTTPMSRSLPPKFSSRSYIVSLTFKSFIHFELIFVYDVR